jgi:hypothetical protein
MKKLYFLDEEEKNRILNLHESATKKQYLSEATEKGGAAYVDPATDTPEAKIAREFYQSASGPGTREGDMLKSIQSIKSAVQFWKVNELVKNLPANSGKLDIAGVINDELGLQDLEDVKKIAESLITTAGITATYGEEDRKLNSGGTVKQFKENSFKITSQPVVAKTAAELDAAWATTYKCVTTQPGAKPSKLKDGSTSYVINGYVYYSNGFKRKMPAASNKSEKYSCAEFKSNKSVVDPNKGNKGSSAAAIAPNIQAVQKQLGIQNATGTLDTATLQAMLSKLGGGVTTAAPQQTVSSVVPSGIVPAGSPASAQLAQLGQTPQQMQQMLNNLTNRPQ